MTNTKKKKVSMNDNNDILFIYYQLEFPFQFIVELLWRVPQRQMPSRESHKVSHARMRMRQTVIKQNVNIITDLSVVIVVIVVVVVGGGVGGDAVSFVVFEAIFVIAVVIIANINAVVITIVIASDAFVNVVVVVNFVVVVAVFFLL